MSDTSVIEEIKSIRLELINLQSRLQALESTSTSTTLKPMSNAQLRPVVTSDKLKNNVTSGSTIANRQTLRSRSFKVMQHLINVVDVSYMDQQIIHVPKRPCKQLQTSGPAKASQKLGRSQPSQQIAKACPPDSAASRSPKPGVQELLKEKSFRPDIPRVFHPKRPRKDIKASSKFICNGEAITDPSLRTHEAMRGSNLDTVTSHQQKTKVKPTHFEKKTPGLDHKPSTIAAKTIQPIKKDALEETTTSVFQTDRFKRNSDRLDLLKLDPDFSDLLPPSGNAYVCSKTKFWTQIKNLPRASSSLIQQQTLGVWEWKEGSSTAKLYEYRVPNSETTIDRRRFKYVGWAWKGEMDQQPPRIQDLPDEIHQGCNTLRWYWFKDLWLLFYFD